LNTIDFGKNMIGLNEGLQSYTWDGAELITSFKQIAGTGWTIAVSADKGEIFSPIKKIAIVSVVVSGIGILIIALIIFLVTRSVTKPIDKISENIKQGAAQVGMGSDQVSSSSQVLAAGASQQAASIEETSASIEEMSAMTSQNAKNADLADNLTKEALEAITRADQTMNKLTLSMDEIAKASEEISKIIKTIDEIAFQTNLLALNAAVEAARAGEAGAGFAVVADEVRNLAIRAADAAKDTSVLIEGTVKKVAEGTEMVLKTNDAFKEVTQTSSKVGGLVSEIAVASGEQAQGIDQINTAVSEMDKIVQQNAATAEESASTSEEMSAQAGLMNQMVNELIILNKGSVAGNGQNHGETIPPISRNPVYSRSLAPVNRGEIRPDQVLSLKKVEDEFSDF
jgi:methyl-accepting chemotaxis protein